MTIVEPNRRARCLIVVPVYNEAHRLQQAPFFDFLAENRLSEGRLSESRFSEGKGDGPAVFLLFVNDGSTDGTLGLLEAMQRRCPERIFILDKRKNEGKGEAIRDGMLTAFTPAGAYKYVGFWDADLATPLTAIPQLLEVFEKHPHIEMVFGSRVRLLGRQIRRNPVRHYLGRIFATVASYTLSLPIYDTQCGAKIFKATPDLEYALTGPFLSRWIFDVEIVAKYLQLRGLEFCLASLYEFPLDAWEDVAGSKLKPFDFFHAGWDILRIYRRYLGKGTR